jgi:CSLREA domain-containing protein
MTQGNRRGSSVGGIRGSAILMTVRSGAVKRRVRAWRPQARALGVMALAWLLTLAPLPWPVPPVMAATFTVNTTADTEDASPGNGVCADSSGNCSLRAAIMEANALSGADTIVLQSGQTYTLSKDTDGDGHATDSGANNDDLDITSTITIQGNGATIRRASTPTCNLNGTTNTGEFRIFEVRHGGSLTLQNVTVRNGCADGSGANNDGGGILNNAGGTLTVTGSTISGNSADDGGGGIRNAGGTLTVINSTISGNSADDGGGISNASGTLTVTNSTISGNSADFGGGISNAGNLTITNSTISGNSTSSSGGGILNNAGGTLTVTGSTISGNSADDDGGGILNNAGGTLTVTGSTISGNSASGFGGGIGNAGNLTITNSTISGNSADDGGGGIRNSGGTANLSFVTIASNSASTGGGISHSGGTVNIKNSIVGNNTASTGPNCSGTVTATGANLDTDGTCTGFTTVPSTGPGGLNLGPLANNGGPTQTHALQAGSAAIDAVPSGQCSDVSGNPVTQDQRGVSFSRPQGSACDVGAYEARPHGYQLPRRLLGELP